MMISNFFFPTIIVQKSKRGFIRIQELKMSLLISNQKLISLHRIYCIGQKMN